MQRVLGFKRYLFYFSLYKIKTLKSDKKEGDFLHFVGLLPKDATVLDIGANIGIMAVWLAQSCPKGQVHAFEPIPENFEALKRIVGHFKLSNVTLHDIALGDEPGAIKMVMPEVQNVKMQGLSHVVHESIPDFNEGNFYEVPVKTLDSMTEIGPVQGIKIDVENFEYFVLKGAGHLLERDKPVVYAELWANENREKCFEFMRGLGYQVQVLEGKRLLEFDPKRHEHQNFFFVHP